MELKVGFPCTFVVHSGTWFKGFKRILRHFDEFLKSCEMNKSFFQLFFSSCQFIPMTCFPRVFGSIDYFLGLLLCLCITLYMAVTITCRVPALF